MKKAGEELVPCVLDTVGTDDSLVSFGSPFALAVSATRIFRKERYPEKF